MEPNAEVASLLGLPSRISHLRYTPTELPKRPWWRRERTPYVSPYDAVRDAEAKRQAAILRGSKH